MTDYTVDLNFLAQKCANRTEALDQVRNYIEHATEEQWEGFMSTAEVRETRPLMDIL